MNSILIEKATELKNKGLTTGEIADELNISKDTAQWLSMQMTNVSKTKQKQKFNNHYNSVSNNSCNSSRNYNLYDDEQQRKR